MAEKVEILDLNALTKKGELPDMDLDSMVGIMGKAEKTLQVIADIHAMVGENRKTLKSIVDNLVSLNKLFVTLNELVVKQ